MRKYTDKEIQNLRDTAVVINSSGIDITVKNSGTEKGCPDKFELPCLDMDKVYKELGEYSEAELYTEPPKSPLEIVRRFLGFPAQCLSTQQIVTAAENIEFENNIIGIWRYFKAKTVNKKRPCLIYIHGGVWVGGTVFTDEYQCKLIAQLADSVVFNIDYPVAPEVKFPMNAECCYQAVKFIYENADKYGIDKDKIMISGDSAGANIAAAVVLMSRDRGTNYFRVQHLLYPGLCMYNAVDRIKNYKWDVNEYDIADEYRDLIISRIDIGTGESLLDKVAVESYFENKADWYNPYAAPMLAESFNGLPETVIITAEFDGLRIQEELYAKMLKNDGVKVDVIRYTGAFHGFFDRLGYVPQAEDACMDMAQILKRL